jgi:hypothetical protein
MENRNITTTNEAQGVLAPLVRCATHVGWCIGYLSEIEAEELTEEQRTAILDDMGDALVHLNHPETSDLLDVFIGAEGLELFRVLREELISLNELPPNKDETLHTLQYIADNTAWTAAKLETAMTGNDAAEAGRNL